MASPKTLELRAWRMMSDIWLKGRYIHAHAKEQLGQPYRRFIPKVQSKGARRKAAAKAKRRILHKV